MTQHLQRLAMAIECLCRVHTRDDPELGFIVQMAAVPGDRCVNERDYVESWRALREIVGMQHGVRLHERSPSDMVER